MEQLEIEEQVAIELQQALQQERRISGNRNMNQTPSTHAVSFQLEQS